MSPSRVSQSLVFRALLALTVLALPGSASAQTPDPHDAVGTHAYLIYYGVTRGAVHGIGASLVFNTRSAPTTGLVVGLHVVGETALAVYLAGRPWMTPGRAHLIGTGMDFGILAGVGIDMAGKVQFDWDSGKNSQLFFSIPLALSFAGAVAAPLLVPSSHLTWGDVELVHMSGLVGGLLGAGVLGKDEPGVGKGMLAGSAVGLIASTYVGWGKDLSLGQSLLLDLGAVAGGVGAGLAVATQTEEPQPIALSAGLGAAVGLGVAYLLLSPGDQAQEPVPPVELSLQFSHGSLGAAPTRTSRPAPTSLLLQGRF
jgi:hypothetical protein